MCAETWLNTNVANQDISLDNFQSPFRKDRVDRLGGGVAIYVKNGYHVGTRLWTFRCMNEVNWVMHSSNSSKSGSDIDEADDIEVD
jgi:hypothetical protein